MIGRLVLSRSPPQPKRQISRPGELADVAVVTSDNPRTEDPLAIIGDILAGMEGADAALHVEPDRRAAIAWALDRGGPGDVIVLAGKGHETYQEINGVQYHMDEREIVADWFRDAQTQPSAAGAFGGGGAAK